MTLEDRRVPVLVTDAGADCADAAARELEDGVLEVLALLECARLTPFSL